MKDVNGASVEPTDVLGFQPNLTHCLYELDKLYRQLHQEQQSIIHRKNKVSNEWFTHRLKTINTYKEALRRTIFIGKALGDSFAWAFYNQDRELIDKHLAKEKQFHTPPGIGGLGERAFIESFSFIGNYFVIYHGITNFLRIGDASLIDLSERKVVAIVELKTTNADDEHLETVFTIVGLNTQAFKREVDTWYKTFPLTPPSQNKSFAESPGTTQLNQHQTNRLNKQTKEMDAFFDRVQVGSTEVKTEFHFQDLENLMEQTKKGKVNHCRASKGLTLVGYTDTRHKFSSRMLSEVDLKEEEWGKLIKKLQKDIKQAAIPGAHNNLVVKPIFNLNPNVEAPLGMTPIFWRPVHTHLIRKILFRNVVVISMYNSSYFFNRLQDAGYTVEYSEEEGRYGISKKLEGKKITFFNIHFFLNMIVEQLYPEDAVFKLFKELIEHSNTEERPTRIDLNIKQQIF